jgi:hypothetical protein
MKQSLDYMDKNPDLAQETNKLHSNFIITRIGPYWQGPSRRRQPYFIDQEPRYVKKKSELHEICTKVSNLWIRNPDLDQEKTSKLLRIGRGRANAYPLYHKL